MSIHHVRVRIRGTRPLLMARFPIEEGIKKHSRRPTKTDDNREEDAEKLAYRLDGPGSELYIPESHILYGLRTGARNHKIGRRAAWPMMTSAVRITPSKIPLGVKKYEIDSQPVVNRSTGARQIAHRPMLREWELAFSLEINDDVLPPELVRASLVDMGLVDGVGTNRARYGKFELVEWNEES